MVGHRVLGPAPCARCRTWPFRFTLHARDGEALLWCVLEARPTHTDYCDVFLTHDSTSVRKAHNCGKNHLQNVRDYYACTSLRLTQRFRRRKSRAWSIR